MHRFCMLPHGAMQEVRKLVEFLVPLASAEELRFTEEDLRANRFGLEVRRHQLNIDSVFVGGCVDT